MNAQQTFKTAAESFETARHLAEGSNQTAIEHLADGLIDLTEAIRRELKAIKNNVGDIKRK